MARHLKGITMKRKFERGENELKVLTLANILASYTIKKCSNNKVFPLKYYNTITAQIIDSSMQAVINIKKANSINVKTKADYELRRKYQMIAESSLDALLGYIEVAKYIFKLNGLSDKKVYHWVRLTDNTIEKLKAWSKSDSQRYKTIIEE